MALENVRKTAPTIYYCYTLPEDGLKEKQAHIKKDEFIEGFYFRTYEKDSQFGKQKSHVLIDLEGTHHVIAGAKDVDNDFTNNCETGLFTRFTYLGKKTFDYTDKEGKQGKAKAIQALIQQDPERKCAFEGDSYSAVAVEGGQTESKTEASAEVKTESAETPDLTAGSIPF